MLFIQNGEIILSNGVEETSECPNSSLYHYSTEQGAPGSSICTIFNFQNRGATLSGELHLLSGTF